MEKLVEKAKTLTYDQVMQLQQLVDKLKHPDIRIDAAQVEVLVKAIQDILK